MMKITGLSHLFKWENLHNWWLTKYFFAPLYIYIYIYVCVYYIEKARHTVIFVIQEPLGIFSRVRAHVLLLFLRGG